MSHRPDSPPIPLPFGHCPRGFRNPRPHEAGERGFTLLETLVAVMILSLSLVMLLQLFSDHLTSAHQSANYSRAVFLGKMKMEELLETVEEPLDIIDGQSEEGYRWSASLSPMPDAQQPDGLSLFVLTVDIFWEQGNRTKHISLSTLTLLDAPEVEG